MRKVIRHYFFISAIFSWFIFTPRIVKDDMFHIFYSAYPTLSYNVYSLAVCYTTKYHVNIHEYMAIMKFESNFNPHAINYNKDSVGNVVSWDSGLGQWNSNNVYGKDPRIFDPSFNLNLSIKYYAECRKKAKGNLRLAFCMYNAGMNRRTYFNGEYANVVGNYYRRTVERASNLIIWM